MNVSTLSSAPPSMDFFSESISTILNPYDLGCQVAKVFLVPDYFTSALNPPEGCPSKTSGGSVYKASPHIPAPS